MLTHLTNATIVTPQEVLKGTLSIENGNICDIGEGCIARGLDCEGDYLIPGIVDIHTDNLERHFFPRANIDWNPVSAAIIHDGLCISVGVTTVFDSLSVGSFGFGEARSSENLFRLTESLHQAHDQALLKATHRLHWRCEAPSDLVVDELEVLGHTPLTGLFSLMDHTPGQRQYRNLEKFLSMWRREGLSEGEIEGRLLDRKDRVARNDTKHRRHVAELAHDLNLPLASHDDETVAHIEEAKSLGATIAEFPVTLEAAIAAEQAGMSVIMGGPNLIRGGSYSGNISVSQLVEHGMHIGFASDYVPRSLIECGFALAHGPWQWPLEKAIDTVTGVPARAVGLVDRGALASGLRADIVRVRVKDGHVLVRGVWVNGQRVG